MQKKKNIYHKTAFFISTNDKHESCKGEIARIPSKARVGALDFQAWESWGF